MGRMYAGVLGPVALLTVQVRGLVHGASVNTMLWNGWLALWAFAALGYVAGRLAGWMVEESIRGRLARELAERNQADGQAAGH